METNARMKKLVNGKHALSGQSEEKQLSRAGKLALSFFLSFLIVLFQVVPVSAAAAAPIPATAATAAAPIPATAATAATPEELLTNPIAQQAERIEGAQPWSFESDAEIVVNAAQMNNEHLQEVVKLCASQLLERNIQVSLAYGSREACTPDDIYVELVPVASITNQSESPEAYALTIGASGVSIKAASENAVIYAFNALQNLFITNNNVIPACSIIDWPDLPERRLFIDCGRKYFSKDWFIQTIREMSYLKLNTLDIHFSENIGFRLQCDTDPAIVSEQHLTKAEMREILAEATRYGINVIPSFDSPGHVNAILKVHPEYGQVSSTGAHYDAGLDITNAEAVAYMKSLYQEYFDLFGAFPCVTDFSIGADEYMEFDRPPFTTQYMSVLDSWAHQYLGADYCWTDTLATYINDMAAFCKQNGLRPRVFNDGLYYGDKTTIKQKVVLDPDLVVDFWSSIPWNYQVASLQTLVDHGLHHFTNLNSGFTYFVLRPEGGASFDYPNNEEMWWNDWRPGLFPGDGNDSVLPDSDSRILGSGICVWCDKPDVCSEDEVSAGIGKSLCFMACQTSNTHAPSHVSMADFTHLTARLGHAAGWEKGTTLPDAGDFHEKNAQYERLTAPTLPATKDVYAQFLWLFKIW